MFRGIVLLVGGLASLSTVSLFAQDAVLGQEYGAGVHAFFTGDYARAYEQLTSAIEGGSKDPRAFYFRGLACLRLGRSPDAVIDFRKGAELESSDINRFYNVGKALERVQGASRLELEDYRVAARMAALEQAEKLRKARYEAVQREESRVLRQQAESAPPGDAEVVPPPSPDEEENPFATAGEAPSARPEKKAAKAGKKAAKSGGDDAEEDPFATDAPKASEKAKEKVKEKVKKGVEKKKAPAEDDPFANEPPKKAEKPADKPKTPPAGGDKKPPDKKTDPNDPFA